MDIAALATVASQMQVRQDASLKVMDKAMGDAEQQGNQMVEMLESSKVQHPDLGNSVDVKA
ncbi:YjfB family protein [Salimicrobium halophilum]|uniref:Putative motility protein n=1 Tax=Salimicrobium halophilum TaxID=86666 RepID=A0A1G8SF97_9BACI|nr:YjfB family protein [Salimicrobium halophilum]SDJ27932.1 Putative motility protein [Salimicrobium halophilum]